MNNFKIQTQDAATVQNKTTVCVLQRNVGETAHLELFEISITNVMRITKLPKLTAVHVCKVTKHKVHVYI